MWLLAFADIFNHHGAHAQVHDELVLEVDAAHLAAVAALVKRCMEGAVSLRVPLPVKMHIGPSWGELEAYGVP